MEIAMIAEHPSLTNSLEDLARPVIAEYKEMPGMRLTFDQARKLFNFSAEDCRKVLSYLLDAALLMEDDHHRFCRQR
jgi:hypothetical protein